MNHLTTEAESEAIKLFRHCITSVPESEWDSLVQKTCEQQPESGGRLAEMLRFQMENSSWLEGTAFSPRTKSLEPIQPKPGDLLCGYRVASVLGQGSASTLVRALGASGPVVIKLPITRLTVEHSLQRFHNECQIHLALSHCNISRAFKVKKLENGSPALVLQAVNGLDIERTCLQQNLSAVEKMDLILQVSSALRYLHNNGYVHGDIKSENIMVEPVGSRLMCKLIDFGKGKDFLIERDSDSKNAPQQHNSSKRNEKMKTQNEFEKALAKDQSDLAWLRNRILTL